MKTLRHAGYSLSDFCKSVSEIASKMGDRILFFEDASSIEDELAYEIPGYSSAHGVAEIESLVGETKDFRFAIIASVSKWELRSYSLYVVKDEEIRDTRPAIGETLDTIERNNKVRGYERKPYICRLRVAMLPREAQKPQFLRLSGEIAEFMFSCDGPLQQETHFNSYQHLAFLDDSIPVPKEAISAAIRSNVLSISFNGNQYRVNLDETYRLADKDAFEEARDAVHEEGKRVVARVLSGLEQKTMFGLNKFLSAELVHEKDPLERQLIIRAMKAISPKKNNSSSYPSSNGVRDGDGAYRSAPGWGGHSAG